MANPMLLAKGVCLIPSIAIGPGMPVKMLTQDSPIPAMTNQTRYSQSTQPAVSTTASSWILTRNCGAVMTWNMDTCVMVERSMTALKIGMPTKTTRSEILMVVSKSFKLNVPSHTKQLLIGCPALPQLLQEQTVLPVSIQISSTASPQATVSTSPMYAMAIPTQAVVGMMRLWTTVFKTTSRGGL